MSFLQAIEERLWVFQIDHGVYRYNQTIRLKEEGAFLPAYEVNLILTATSLRFVPLSRGDVFSLPLNVQPFTVLLFPSPRNQRPFTALHLKPGSSPKPLASLTGCNLPVLYMELHKILAHQSRHPPTLTLSPEAADFQYRFAVGGYDSLPMGLLDCLTERNEGGVIRQSFVTELWKNEEKGKEVLQVVSYHHDLKRIVRESVMRDQLVAGAWTYQRFKGTVTGIPRLVPTKGMKLKAMVGQLLNNFSDKTLSLQSDPLQFHSSQTLIAELIPSKPSLHSHPVMNEASEEERADTRKERRLGADSLICNELIKDALQNFLTAKEEDDYDQQEYIQQDQNEQGEQGEKGEEWAGAEAEAEAEGRQRFYEQDEQDYLRQLQRPQND